MILILVGVILLHAGMCARPINNITINFFWQLIHTVTCLMLLMVRILIAYTSNATFMSTDIMYVHFHEDFTSHSQTLIFQFISGICANVSRSAIYYSDVSIRNFSRKKSVTIANYSEDISSLCDSLIGGFL